MDALLVLIRRVPRRAKNNDNKKVVCRVKQPELRCRDFTGYYFVLLVESNGRNEGQQNKGLSMNVWS